MLSKLVIAFLPRSKCLLISWLQSPSAVIFEPKKIKFVTASIISPYICHEVMRLDAMLFVFQMWKSMIFHPAILTVACASSSPAFCMMYSAYKLNIHGDNIQAWCTPFPIWNQSLPCLLLTVASWPAYTCVHTYIHTYISWPAYTYVHTYIHISGGR